MLGVRGGENEELFNGYRASVLQEYKGSGDGLHTSVSVFHTSDLYT